MWNDYYNQSVLAYADLVNLSTREDAVRLAYSCAIL